MAKVFQTEFGALHAEPGLGESNAEIEPHNLNQLIYWDWPILGLLAGSASGASSGHREGRADRDIYLKRCDEQYRNYDLWEVNIEDLEGFTETLFRRASKDLVRNLRIKIVGVLFHTVLFITPRHCSYFEPLGWLLGHF